MDSNLSNLLFGLIMGMIFCFILLYRMEKVKKDQILIAVSIIILLFTAMIEWNIYSWLILLLIILILFVWHAKN